MTLSRAARLVAVTLIGVVVAAAAIYTVVYLYRWEWTRALIAGQFVVIGEVALAAWLILSRLTRLERTVTDREPAKERVPDPVASPPAERESPFAWLHPTGGFGVFVPVLLGAGLILSALAYVVQRIAEKTARLRTGGRSLTRPAPAAPLVEGLVPQGTLATDELLGPLRPSEGRRQARPVLWLVLAALSALVGLAALDRLADATQTRPETANGVDTVILLDVATDGRAPTDAAVELWQACAARARVGAQLVSMTPIDRQRVVMVVAPGLGDQGWRRLEGCLEDMTVLGTTAAAQRLTSVGS